MFSANLPYYPFCSLAGGDLLPLFGQFLRRISKKS